MRKYNLASLTLSTAGGNTEIKLIDKNKANTLKQEIKKVIILCHRIYNKNLS